MNHLKKYQQKVGEKPEKLLTNMYSNP